jgi:predicted Na+-dependent transporter
MVDWIALAGNVLLFALVFGMSATVDIDSCRTQVRNGRAILTGILCQFLVLPMLGFLVVNTLNLDTGIGITLLVVTSSPGGSYSNWFCSVFNGDLALSVTMTAISTILSILMLPLNLLIYTRFSYEGDILANLDWNALFLALLIVIGAIGLGLFCSAKIRSRRFNMWSNHVGNFAGLALIIFSATMTNTGGADTKIWSRDWSFYVGVTLPCLGGLVLANIIATAFRLDKPERVTVAIECCYQNVGIATSLALSMFKGNDLNAAMGVPFFYGVMEAVLVGIYCIGAWKAGWTKAPADAPLWKVMFTSYEILEQEFKDVDEVEVAVSESDEIVQDAHEGNILTTYFNLAWGGPEVSNANDGNTPSNTKNTSDPPGRMA